MSLIELHIDIEAMLSALHLAYRKVSAGKYLPDIDLIEDFGFIVVGLERKDYTQLKSKLTLEYVGYKLFFIEEEDNLSEKKEEVIWELMRLGYMSHIRNNYARQFNQLIHGGFGRKIIKQRLKVWNDQPMYKYLIDTNKLALEFPENTILAKDPSFFDYMP